MKTKTIIFAAMLLALGVFVACNNDRNGTNYNGGYFNFEDFDNNNGYTIKSILKK